MERHNIFFLIALSFLSGVFFASLGLSPLLSLIPAVIVFAVLYATNTRLSIAVCAGIFLVSGVIYYVQDDHRYQTMIAGVPSDGKMQGTILEDPKHYIDFQSFSIKTQFGTIAVETKAAPEYSYGETLSIIGKILPPPENYSSRHVVGLMRNPNIEIISSSGGNLILTFLFGIKNNIRNSFQKMFSPEQSALLFGILFGVNDGFSKQFAQNLANSGLRFITAIDGLHMQIVLLILFGAFAYLLPKRYAYLVTFIFVCLFIAMTGFTASGIRASLMAAIAVLAKETGRIYAPHNALALVALILTLINPKVLAYDVGFQLSFLAVLSIIYFLPVLRKIIHARETPGILGWRESLLITISVQLATAPIVITQFQNFSLTSFVGSVAIVWALPFILSLGFLTALFSLVLYPIAFIFSFLIRPIIDYVIIVVNLCAHMAVLFNPSFPFITLLLYYGVLVSLMYWFYSDIQKKSPVVLAHTARDMKDKPDTGGIKAEDFKIIEI